MPDSYIFDERVRGEYRALSGDLVVLDYEPGESYSPASPAEAEALAYLAASGKAKHGSKAHKPPRAQEDSPAESPADATTTEES